MRRLLPLSFALLLLTVACHHPTREELAAKAAKTYYDQLISGQYEQYLDGVDGAAALPENYREQLLIGYRQFIAHQQQEHNGIREVRIAEARGDTTSQSQVNAFLVLCFGDSTNEEICVPMVEHDGEWKMK